MERRNFILSSSAAMAAIISGCRKPGEKLVSGIITNNDNPAGEKIYYKTVYPHLDVPYTIAVKTIDSRPVKIDGSDINLYNRNGTNALIQSSLYSLYDPARFNYAKIDNNKIDIDNALSIIKSKIADILQNRRINIIHSNNNSIVLNYTLASIKNKYPNVNIIKKNNNNCSLLPLTLVKKILLQYNEIKPLIISLGYDFLGGSDYSLFFQSYLYHEADDGKKKRNAEILVAEPYLSLSGMNADIRETADLKQLQLYAEQIRNYLKTRKQPANDSSSKLLNRIFDTNLDRDIILLTSDDLGSSIDFEYYGKNGEYLANHNHSVIYEQESIVDNTDDFFIFLDFNPLYLGNQERLKLIKSIPKQNMISISLYNDEISSYCSNFVPMAHYLESWDLLRYSDYETILIQQPVISKLNPNSTSITDFLINIFGLIEFENCYNLIKKFAAVDEDKWIEYVRQGFFSQINRHENVETTYAEKESLTVNYDPNQIYLLKVNNPYFLCGNEINNPYLHEIPHPITKQYYGNSAQMNYETAQKYSLKHGETIKISSGATQIELPVIISPGIADNLMVSEMNFGHEINSNLILEKFNTLDLIKCCFGVNINHLSLHNDIRLPIPVKIEKSSNSSNNLILSDNKQIFALSKPINKYSHEEIENLKISEKKTKIRLTKRKEIEYLREKWEIIIDASACTGCNSCVISCNVENNIPMTGPINIKNKRDMAWLMVNSYIFHYKDEIKSEFQPLMCQHCEAAPCEPVCPVSASTHSPSGLNEMVYNRCIGARFCMVNCPYEVRTFNFENYRTDNNSILNLMLNPDVTIRSRGVSEKCTFCVQRINESKFLVNRVKEENITTACQDACPVNAITFGNKLDKSSKLSRMVLNSEIELNNILDNLGTKPSVHYINRYPGEK